MRVVSLLLCLSLCPLLAGCLATSDQPPAASAAPAASPAMRGSAGGGPVGGGGGPRGGASTAAARGEPEEVPPDPVIQARTDCWMAVEHNKSVRGLDERIAYVDKCVAGKTGAKP
jgi:hypothetical protein